MNKDLRKVSLKTKFPDMKGKSNTNLLRSSLIQNFEKNNSKESSIIDLLLKSPTLLDNDILTQAKQFPSKIEGVGAFENDYAKKLYEDVYKWNWCLEQEIKEEEKYFQEKLILKHSTANKKV